MLLLLLWQPSIGLAKEKAKAKENVREVWLAYMDKVARPVIANLASDKLKETMPIVLSKTIDNPEHRKKVAYLEAFARTLCGISPWLNLEGGSIGFRVTWRHPLSDLQRAFNAVLPADVVVPTLTEAAQDWHPRFSARRRSYRYTVLNRTLRSPLDRRYAHLVPEPLNLEALQTAAEALLGQHDFASFGQPTQGDSTVRVIYETRWQRTGAWVTFDVIGNAFLRGMVRNLVGTLLQVGTGRWPVERVAEILTGRNRALAAAPAPACGLCLINVEYE